jgi:hypothetical protein
MTDEDRTNSMGLFNRAEAYRLSAMALENRQLRHVHEPIEFLYCHSVELYLKALVRQKHGVKKLQKKFSHNIGRLVRAAEKLGLNISQHDHELLAMMNDTDMMIESRYIRTGTKTRPTFAALRYTSKNVRDGVGSLLRQNGVMVRL